MATWGRWLSAFQQKGLDNLMNFPRVLGPYGSGLKHPQPQREPSGAPWLVGYATTMLPVTVTTTFVADVVTMVRAIAMDGLSMSAGLASDSSRTRTISTSTCKPINLGTSCVLYVARSALSPLQELRCTWSQVIVLAVANGAPAICDRSDSNDSNEDPYCRSCDRSFESMGALLQHMEAKHDSRVGLPRKPSNGAALQKFDL